MNHAGITVDAVRARFPAARPVDGFGPVSTAAFMTDHALGMLSEVRCSRNTIPCCVMSSSSCRSSFHVTRVNIVVSASDLCSRVVSRAVQPSVTGLCFLEPRDHSTLSCALRWRLPEQSPSASSPPQQWSRDGAADMAPRWRALWAATCAALDEQLRSIRACDELQRSLVEDVGARDGDGVSGVLAYLYSRLGWECGRALRGMHDQRVSWGTYQVRPSRSALFCSPLPWCSALCAELAAALAASA